MINSIKIEITQKQIEKFNKLKSIQSKINFWQTEFNVPYYYWNKIPQGEIQSIIVKPKNAEETETLNYLVLRYYEETNIVIRNSMKLFDLEEKKKSFINKIEKVKNKIYFKETEYKEIEKAKSSFINTGINNPYQFSIINFFEKSYSDFLYNNQEPDYSERVFEIETLIATENGFRMAQYYKFIEEYKPTNLIDLSLNEKILLLEYLGILDILYKEHEFSINATAKIINTLTGMDISNIEKSYKNNFIKKQHSLKNIRRVIEYLENVGLQTLSESIRKKENFIE